VRPFALLFAVLLPLPVLAWLLTTPASNQPLSSPIEHFVITTNVSVVTFVVAVLTARAALQVGHYPTLLVALGFMSLAGIFTVHGLSTPGVLQRGDRSTDASLVVAVSGQLALLVPALFFAARYTPLAAWLDRRVPPRALLGGVLVALVGYAAIALANPSALGGIARWMLVAAGSYGDYDPYGSASATYRLPDPFGGAGLLPYILAVGVVVLFGLAALRQGHDFVRTRLPMQGALAVAHVLLAQAQVSQFLGPVWTPAWWEYHVLMLMAATIALGALFIELDRRRGLERFLPRIVVERVLEGDPLRLEGERQTVTILFSDLRGSTAMAEHLQPEQVIAVINAYLRVMARCVIAAGGIIDKFTGDGLMAIFGAMDDPAHGASAATRAAIDMRSRLWRLNAEREGRGEPVMSFGIGLHTGEAVLGAVGLPERSDYSAFGDTVNTASRMEALTKEYEVETVLSGETAELLDGKHASLRPLGLARVRGRQAAMRIFTLR
jgi:adenylate cyclase